MHRWAHLTSSPLWGILTQSGRGLLLYHLGQNWLLHTHTLMHSNAKLRYSPKLLHIKCLQHALPMLSFRRTRFSTRQYDLADTGNIYLFAGMYEGLLYWVGWLCQNELAPPKRDQHRQMQLLCLAAPLHWREQSQAAVHHHHHQYMCGGEV